MRRCATDGRQLRYGRMKYKGIIVAAASRTQSTDWCTVCIVFSKYALRVCSLYAGMSTHQGNDNVSATTDNSTLCRIVLPAVTHQTLQKGIEEAHIPHGRVHISHSKAVMPWVGITVLSVMHGQCDANPIRTPSCTATSTLWQPVSNYTARCVCVCVLLAQGRYPKSSAMTTTKNQELLTSCCSVRTALRHGHVSSVTFPKHRSDVG